MAQRNQNDEQGEMCENRQFHTLVLETVCLISLSMNYGEDYFSNQGAISASNSWLLVT